MTTLNATARRTAPANIRISVPYADVAEPSVVSPQTAEPNGPLHLSSAVQVEIVPASWDHVHHATAASLDTEHPTTALLPTESKRFASDLHATASCSAG